MLRLWPKLQASVEHLHDVALGLEVGAYLVDDAARADIDGAAAQLPEQLFVREAQDAVELALYVAPAVVAELSTHDPFLQLTASNLEPFCVALEGVSHFVYVAWRAAAGWSTRALELELQAEVDKFVASWLLLRQQGHAATGAADVLLRALFGAYRLHEGLSADERSRYHLASRSAAYFCRELRRRHARGGAEEAMVREVRAYSRRDLQLKLIA